VSSARSAVSGIGSCPSCARLTVLRNRRCIRCGALLPFAYLRRDDLEHRIDLLAVAGIAAALVLLGGAALVWFEHPTRGLIVGAVAFAIGISHLLTRWFRTAWTIALAAWTALVVTAAMLLREDKALAAIAAVACFCALTFVQLVYRRLVPYLDGERLEERAVAETSDDGLCAHCTERATQAVAPLWCVSLLFMTSVTIGKPKRLCLAHARRNAIPASVFSAVFGWWGFPWGLVRTPEVIWRNLSAGGAPVDSDVARGLYEIERTGQAGWLNFFPGVRSKPIAVLGLLLFMFVIFGSALIFLSAR
jgi:hypothetical protein